MGLLYDMVIKKRKSAVLMQETDAWKQKVSNRLDRKLAVARTISGQNHFYKVYS